MAEITKIKAQRNKKRVNVYLDGKFAFGLNADNFIKAGLRVGQKLTERQVDDLIFKNEFQKLLDRTLRLISARPRSEKEIRDYLKKRIRKFRESQSGIKDRLMGDIVKYLKKQKLVDDKAFATWWVEQRSTFRPRGKFGLEMELRQKGIDKMIRKKVIDERVDELPLAKRVAQKKLKSYKNLPREERCQKISAYLVRRGFSRSTIKLIIDQHSKKG